MNESLKPNYFAVALTAIAAVWLLLAPVLGHMGPPWPCFFLGLFLAISAAMLFRNPDRARGAGVLIVVFSGLSFLLGSDAFIPAFLGVIGGLAAVAKAPSRINPPNHDRL